MNYLSIEQLVSRLKELNINLGKGDPYNRLRYYTKMGWIPNMSRKKDLKGIVTGHYPESVLETLVKIENYKKEGKSNEDIGNLLKRNSNKNLQKFNLWLNSIKSKVNLPTFLLIILVTFIILEMGYSSFQKNGVFISSTRTDLLSLTNSNIKDSGIGIFPSNKIETFIPSKFLNENSVVIVAFEDELEFGNNYYISKKEPNKGFYLRINIPKVQDLKFNWIVID